MEITLHEDPACPWCWAFQPVTTTLEFEFPGTGRKPPVRIRRVMGGASDRPAADSAYLTRQWRRAEKISGMPFNPDIWEGHFIRTTFEACRAVKAAQAQGSDHGARLLRRLREAFFVEGVPIDGREAIISLAISEGLDADSLREGLANGRADLLFQRDRHEAMGNFFGFPTTLIRKHPTEPASILHGLVSYEELLGTLYRLGLSPRERRRFTGTSADWDRLFELRPRIAAAEVSAVTGLMDQELEEAIAARCEQDGPLLLKRRSPALADPPGEPAAVLQSEAPLSPAEATESTAQGAGDTYPTHEAQQPIAV